MIPFAPVFALLGAALLGEAQAQEAPPLPLHGWVRLDGNLTPLESGGTAGVAVPISRVTAFLVEGKGTGTAAGLSVGPSFEIGALYLAPMLGSEYDYASGVGLTGQVRGAFEAPPLPIYVEAWGQAGVHSLFTTGAGDTWRGETLILLTFRRWLALGFEDDLLVTIGQPSGPGYNPVGLRANFGLGDHAVIGLFAGYELDADARAAALGPDFLAARLTTSFTW